MTSAQLDPLVEPHPDLTADGIAQLLAETWAVGGELQPLPAERDLNFRVVDASGTMFVVKVHNPADGEAVVDFQTAALRHVAVVAPDLPVGDVVPTTDGRLWTTVSDATGRTCHARLLTHLPGHHAGGDDLDADDLFAWGAVAARLGRALRGFFHPAAGYPIAWDVRRLPALRNRTDAVDAQQRDLVLDLIDRHERHVAPVLAAARAQVVHNDLSLGNVLVDDRNRISGITDFGDMTHTPLVCDLAVTVADVLAGRDDALALAEPMIAGYASVTPLEPGEADLLADLVAGRCVTALVIQSWRASLHSTAPGPPQGVRRMLIEMQAVGFDRVAARFAAVATGSPMRRHRSTDQLLAARSDTLGPLSLSYRKPIHLVSGRGVDLLAADGRGYLDAYNNVPVLGHSHPAVTAAVTAQLQRLSTNTRYLHEAPVELAEELLATMPSGGRFDRVLFVNSGSEANDLAWRIACFTTARSGGVVTEFAYHGVTTVTTKLSPEELGDARPDDIRLVAPPPPVGSGNVTAAVTAAAKDLDAAGFGLAAMFVDGVFTSDGVLGPAHEWTRAAADAVHAAGGLYVADEVQAGYGRSGDHLWSFAAGDVGADLVTLGKPMGNGFPVAAVITRSDIVDDFIRATGYFSTYGGNMAACAAALAVLRTVQREGLIEHARAVGAHLAAALADVANGDGRLAPPRAWGLAIGVDVLDVDGRRSAALASAIVDTMRDRGVLIGQTAADGATLKIRPPLVFTTEHADRLAGDLRAVLASV